ncbi:uncharacterized protein NEMAJ01_0625 [Nematocida major]|uniref:uncharacterized protein n=1 Tax=Nematocida major TaxID=1912982 RepID=UPI002007E4AB|nr:uncharacterized protein NEMAJ01_0625 [Nematocida major]KAH9385729.1 hypothetical protein NEMAJ01_0625 [Nematocida major]
MSKFFEGLDDAPQKKVRSAISAEMEDDECGEEKPSLSNKEKKDEEVAQMCRDASFKKPKDVEQFFKKLTKYSAHFSRQGVPSALLEFLAETEGKKETPSIFKQKKIKFLEKYQEAEVVLELVEEKKKKKSYMEEISKTYLIESLEKRKAALLEIEGVGDLSSSERHRINLYMTSCLIEESMQEHYAEIVRRMKKEAEFVDAKEEADLLRTRVGKYVKKLIKNIQIQDRNGESWESQYKDLQEIALALKKATSVPEEGLLEVDYFLRREKPAPCPHLSNEFIQKEVSSHGYPQFEMVDKIRSLPLEEALALHREHASSTLSAEGESAEHSVTICFYKMAEELGMRAFAERDFASAMDLLETVYYNKTIWSSPQTEQILEVLCLCFEKKMKEKKFFDVFKKSLLQIGDNLLLLRSQNPKMEIARAFTFLRLGDYMGAHAIVASLLPNFNCENLLRARAMEILLTPSE